MKRSARPGTTKYMAQGSHRHALTVVAQHLQSTDTTHNGDAHWAISIGLSTVLWIGIPDAASIVAPKRRKKEESPPSLSFLMYH